MGAWSPAVRVFLCAAAVSLFAARAARAQSAPPATQPQVEHFQVRFTDRSPHSEIGTQHRRHHIATDEKQRYELSEESFEVFVPESYDGERPFGLLVWVSPMPSGRLPQMWEKAIEQHNLIWIGANQSGNE